MLQQMTEIRWHARGGQGAKSAANMVADAVLLEGKYSQSFPEYGPERMGAPVRGFTRISDKPITIHCAIEEPDIVVVIDESLCGPANVTEHLKANGTVLVNTAKSPEEIRKVLKVPATVKVWTVNALQIALDTIGKPIPNTPMIGALLKATHIADMQQMAKDIKKKFERKFGERVTKGNVDALTRAFEEVKQG